jgi:hypothetical protein
MDIFEMEEESPLSAVANQKIRELYDKYENDLYMTSKIHHYISVQLPTLLENIQEARQKSIQRTSELTFEQEKFMNWFLSKHNYYYLATNETFFSYDGIHFNESNENDILYHIVSSISQERNDALMSWKHKTKVSILKRIKEKSLMKNIPESETIQNVLNLLHPSLFSTKTEAKYFLTILGDNIMKKNTSLIHFISPSAKSFLRELNAVCMTYMNCQCIQSFKYKCHEKHYEYENKDCRLVSINDSVKSNFRFIFSECGLDLLCVACHYSMRYEHSDQFVEKHCNDVELQQYVFKLKITTPEDIIQHFAQEYITTISSSKQEEEFCAASPQEDYFIQTSQPIKANSLTWKQMLFLWKEYLSVNKYPLNLYQPLVKKVLSQTFATHYDPEQDVFNGLGSTLMPMVQKFLRFWTETMIEDSDHELEIDDIGILFRMWLGNRSKNKRQYVLNENKIIRMLNHFHPELEIEKLKFIHKTRCLLWDKDLDIETALTTLQDQGTTILDDVDNTSTSITIYSAYLYYCKFHSLEKDKKLLVSKSYFESYVLNHMKPTVV